MEGCFFENLHIYYAVARNKTAHWKDSKETTLEMRIKQTFRVHMTFLLPACHEDVWQGNYSYVSSINRG